MNNTLKSTKDNDWAGLVLRLTLALVMLPHTFQHTVGALGGYGYTGMMNYFTGSLHIPWLLGFLVIVTEVIAPVLLLVGLESRMASFSLILLMIGIIYTTHFQNGFFMNWLKNQPGEGYEYHLLYIGLAVATMFNGSGKYSLDEVLASNKKEKTGLRHAGEGFVRPA